MTELYTKELTETLTLTSKVNQGLNREYIETISLSDGDIYGLLIDLTEILNLNDVGIILRGQGEVIISTNPIKPKIISGFSVDYE